MGRKFQDAFGNFGTDVSQSGYFLAEILYFVFLQVLEYSGAGLIPQQHHQDGCPFCACYLSGLLCHGQRHVYAFSCNKERSS